MKEKIFEKKYEDLIKLSIVALLVVILFSLAIVNIKSQADFYIAIVPTIIGLIVMAIALWSEFKNIKKTK